MICIVWEKKSLLSPANASMQGQGNSQLGQCDVIGCCVRAYAYNFLGGICMLHAAGGRTKLSYGWKLGWKW